MTAEITVRNLEELLDASSATAEFKKAVEELAANRPQDRVLGNEGSPPVKMLRFVMKLIEQHPELPLEKVSVEGESSCSGYVGHAIAQPGDQRFEFDWNCAWRATEEGWTDAFGDADQIRAARTLGYQCFRRFEKI
jgi:hypothetical protein